MHTESDDPQINKGTEIGNSVEITAPEATSCPYVTSVAQSPWVKYTCGGSMTSVKRSTSFSSSIGSTPSRGT